MSIGSPVHCYAYDSSGLSNGFLGTGLVISIVYLSFFHECLVMSQLWNSDFLIILNDIFLALFNQ